MKHYDHSHAHVWSNVAFIIAAAVLAFNNLYLPAAGVGFLGVSSWIGHLKGGKWWFLDWAGMYVSFLSIIAHHLDIPYTWISWPLIVYLTMRFRFDSIVLTGVLFVTACFLASMVNIYYIGAIVYFAIALMFRQMTSDGDSEYNFFHSLWHVMCAIGYTLLVL